MPTGDRSEPTILVEMVVEAMQEARDTLVEEWGDVPFLEEKITREEYIRRFNAMTPEQKQDEIARIGLEQVLEQLGLNKEE